MVLRVRDDDGQAAVLVVAMASVLFMTMLAGLSAVGGRVVDRAHAQTAADAAALASLDGGRAAAQRMAAAHGARIVLVTTGPGDEVTVQVDYGSATATARATAAP